MPQSSDEELIAQAEVGEEAKKFLESDLGKILVGLATQEADLAREKLETVDPKDEAKIRELQFQIKFGRSFERWLNDLVSDGDNAFQTLQHQSHE
jgi:hypothetical protein